MTYNFFELLNKIIGSHTQKLYMYEKYIYNLKIDIKEQSLYFINQLINNNKTPIEVKKLLLMNYIIDLLD